MGRVDYFSYDLLHRGLQQVSLCLCKHCCRCYLRGVDFYEREDFQVFAIPSSAVGRLARQYRRELSQETSDEMGEENNKNPGHCTGVVFSVLPSCMYLHIHHKLLHKLRLRVYSLGKRHSDCYDNGKFGCKSFRVRLEVGKFSKGFQEHSDLPRVHGATEVHFSFEFNTATCINNSDDGCVLKQP